jgi:hypothetical protein
MADEELVKVTIRLPKSLVKEGKLVALALEMDLQDLVRDALLFHVTQRKLRANLTTFVSRMADVNKRIQKRKGGA